MLFKSGKLNPSEFINKLNESGDNQLQAMAAALKSNSELRNAMGIGTKTIENTAKTMAEGALESTQEAIEKNAQRIDPYTNFANTVKNTTDTLSKTIDEILKLIRPMVLDALSTLAEVTRKLVLSFANSKLAKDLGLDFSGIIPLLESDDEVRAKQINLVESVEPPDENNTHPELLKDVFN